jgi:hypothetical protein
MGLKINGSTDGSIEVDVPASCGSDLSITLPATAGEIVVADTNGDAAFSSTGSGGSSGSAQLAGYQQGSWTPEVAGSTTAGTYTYGSNTGLWTRIGNLVYIQATLSNISTTDAGTGTMLCTGFPYDPATDNVSTGSVRFDQVDLPADTAYVTAGATNNPQCSFQAVKDDLNDVSVSLSATAFASTSADIFVTMTYITSDTTWTPNAGASVS